MTVMRICTDEVYGLLRKPELLLIDVRDKSSYEKGRIGSALHADTRALEKLVMTVPKSTPILLYCYHGKSSLVHGQMFVDFGFTEVYSLNGGYEGWMYLQKKGRLQAWLEEHDFPEVNSAFHDGTTPLMLASRLGETAIVAELLVSGANLNARNNDGNQALWFACFSGNLDIMDLLIAAGINIDNGNDNGSTCLMYASSSGKDAVVEKLLEAGADIGLMNLDDYTALDMAATIGCLNLLRNAGAPA